MSSIEKNEMTPMFTKKIQTPELKEHPPSVDSSDDEDEPQDNDNQCIGLGKLSNSTFGSKGALHSPIGSTHSFDMQVNIKLSSLETNKIANPTFLSVKFNFFSFFVFH